MLDNCSPELTAVGLYVSAHLGMEYRDLTLERRMCAVLGKKESMAAR